MTITLSDSIAQCFSMVFLPSEIVTLYFPNGESNAMMIGSSNSQFPLASISTVLELIISPSNVAISAVIVLPGVPVPKISKKSPL